MSLTTKTLEHVVLAYNLPRGLADRGKVVQMTAQAEAPHAALAAQADRIHTAMRLRAGSRQTSAAVVKDAGQKLAYVYFEDEPGRRSAADEGAADCGEYRQGAEVIEAVRSSLRAEVNARLGLNVAELYEVVPFVVGRETICDLERAQSQSQLDESILFGSRRTLSNCRS